MKRITLLVSLVFLVPLIADSINQNPAPADPVKLSAPPAVKPAQVAISNTTETIVVPTVAAPPAWAQELIMTAEKLPLVGPLVSKVLVYLGIFGSIMTVLVGTVLTIINSLLGVFNVSGLVEAAGWLAKFKDGKFMYWLKFFSLFNAKKEPPTSLSQAK